MDILINSKATRILAAVLMLALVAVTLVLIWPRVFAPEATPDPGLSPDALAAQVAVTAFYTMDYTESPELWPARVCAYTTEKGCLAVRDFYAPSVRAAIEKYKIQTECEVEPIQLMLDAGSQRIWKLQVTLTNPWTELSIATQEAYAEVDYQDGQWLLNRILFEQEIAHLLTPAP
jgi:hypothetical protein